MPFRPRSSVRTTRVPPARLSKVYEALEDLPARPWASSILLVFGQMLKPLNGAKGRNVFMIHDEQEANLAQMPEAVLEDGYAVVQEFVEGGEDGDTRIFLLEGRLLALDGQVAAFRRVPSDNDPRANISAGGHSVAMELGETERTMVESMREKLVADGMFFVGIDVIGGKVVEINAESPGAFQSLERLYGVDFGPTVIEALERRAATVGPVALPAPGAVGGVLPDELRPGPVTRLTPPDAAAIQ